MSYTITVTEDQLALVQNALRMAESHCRVSAREHADSAVLANYRGLGDRAENDLFSQSLMLETARQYADVRSAIATQAQSGI